MKNFEKFMERIDDTPYGELDCEGFLKNVYQDKNFECPSYDCYVCLAKAMKYLNEEYIEPIQLSHDEYVILKNLPNKYKWIVRSGGGYLELYCYKPEKDETDGFWITNGVGFNYYGSLFRFIKWEDEEPYSIQQLIADYEKEHGDE